MVGRFAERGLTIAAWYVENESGAMLARPELFRLLGDAHPGDILQVEQVDRLSRLTAADWERLKAELTARRMRVVALDLPTSWMMATNAGDEFIVRMFEAINGMLLDMLAAVARKDYVDRRRRQAQGQAKAKTEGRYKGRPEDAERNDGIARMLAARQSWGVNPERDRLQPRDDREDCKTPQRNRANYHRLMRDCKKRHRGRAPPNPPLGRYALCCGRSDRRAALCRRGGRRSIRILRKLFRVSFDEKQLLWFWSVDAAPNSSPVDLHDAFSSYAEPLCEPREQAVAVISRPRGLLFDAIVGEAIDDEPGLLSRQDLFFGEISFTQQFP